jgi:hypothetical protein
MKTTSVQPLPACARRGRASFRVSKACVFPRLKRGLGVLAAVALLGAGAQAQLQQAGELYVNLDATTLPTGSWNDLTNAGSLGGFFEPNTGTVIANVGGVNGLVLGGTNYLRLLNGIGGTLVAPPGGLVGSNATCSIEVWALNPAVAADECLVAWGGRNTGQNLAFEYGNGSSGGAQHNTPDLAWDSTVGGGAPLNNRWHHLVYTYDGASQNLYADGVLVNSAAVSFSTMTNAGLALGAQWTSAVNAISTTPAYATLTLARVRVHDGALTAAQVLNNYNFEKALFTPPVAPAYLTAGPVHRYSFNEPAADNASGQAIHDSVGTAHGTVQGSPWIVAPQFTGRRLVLPGGFDTTLANFGAPYADLPNGLVSINSTNNGGSGEVSIEIWFKNTGGTASSNPRVFDFGSVGPSSPAVGQEVLGPGGYPSGSNGLDMVFYAQVGSSPNQRRLGWLNKDTLPSGTTVNTVTINTDACLLGSYQSDRHLVVTWKESTGQFIAYENGLPVVSSYVSNSISALNDVNMWLGRANNSGNGAWAGEYDEVRFYNYVLSPAQVVGNYQVGPETVNTAAQAAAIATQPRSATAFQGWPVSFFVQATGSPGLSYQWQRNGAPIIGATSDTLSLPAASLADNGAAYSCVVSNFTGTANVLTSSAATLTVLPNQMPPRQVLYETKDANAATSSRNDQTSAVGTEFVTGPAGALVTHLGMYDAYGDGLNTSHQVGLFLAQNSNLIAEVTVPAGGAPTTPESYGVDNYRYVALPRPLLLAPNTGYFLQAMVGAGDNDLWPAAWAPAHWNRFYVGATGSDTRRTRWGANGTGWPPQPANWRVGAFNGQTLGAPNLAILPVGAPVAAMSQTSVTQYASLSLTLQAAVCGQAPLALQWFKVGTPDRLLTGQTSAALTLNNLAVSDAGNYYVVASNAVASAVRSDDAVLTVLADMPVSITQQPANLAVPEGFGASFSVSAAGTPPLCYQWRRNGIAIPDETNATYNIPAAALADNGAVYSCVVSNFANAAPHTATSGNAVLTVWRNVGPALQTLVPTTLGGRDNFNGTVGGRFRVGETPALVTHLGFYCVNGALNYPHHVALWPASGGDTPLAWVFVPDAQTFVTNGYAWAPLPTPLVLEANTAYILGAEVYNASGDPWPDLFTPTSWNPYYVGNTATSTRGGRFGNSVYFPTAPTSVNTANMIYGAPNLAVMPLGPAIARMGQTNLTQWQGLSATLVALVAGQAPLTVQWYKAPGTLLAGQTNTTLFFSSLTPSDAGDYYVQVSNGLGTAQSDTTTLTVQAPVAPTITQPPQSQTVYPHQSATFSVLATGAPPLRYQWSRNSVPIAEATNSSLTLAGASGPLAGTYSVLVTNAMGPASAAAVLTVTNPPAGSYVATVLGLNPLVYYRFSDVTNGTGAFNLGSLGTLGNGTYEGACTADLGPEPPDFANFEPDNQALALEGTTADLQVPALNLPLSSATIAGWVYKGTDQALNAAIYFHRSSPDVFGLSTYPDPVAGGDALRYTWNGAFFNFASGLILPTNQWAFVALVVQPSGATLYLQDGTGMKTANNPANHPSQNLSATSYIGWDNYQQTRRWKGRIDETMLFDRALSGSEIDSLYQAGALPPAVSLQIQLAGDKVILSWPSGTLQQADTVNGTYSDLAGVTSPYTNTAAGTQKFFRVKVR